MRVEEERREMQLLRAFGNGVRSLGERERKAQADKTTKRE
jgi:hypothetical protein